MVAVDVGVLSLQGDFAEHLAVLDRCSLPAQQVRTAEDLQAVDALIIPGGESTTMLKLIDRYDMRELLVKRIETGMPVFGTCAGAIVLAEQVSDGERSLGVLPIRVTRNAYGRQAASFEADIDVPVLGGSVRGVFIRAPIIEDPVGTEVLGSWDGKAVLVRSGKIVVSTFHPELVGEDRLHRWFVERVCGGEV